MIFSRVRRPAIREQKPSAEMRSRVGLDAPFYSKEEVSAKIKALTRSELQAIKDCAIAQRGKLGHDEDEHDLMQEAFQRAISQGRHWRKEYSAVQFFAGRNGVIRSIASARYKSRSGNVSITSDNESQIGSIPTSDVTALQLYSLMWESLADDPVCQSMLYDMQVGIFGEELCEKYGITAMELASKQKWIRRQLLKLREGNQL